MPDYLLDSLIAFDSTSAISNCVTDSVTIPFVNDLLAATTAPLDKTKPVPAPRSPRKLPPNISLRKLPTLPQRKAEFGTTFTLMDQSSGTNTSGVKETQESNKCLKVDKSEDYAIANTAEEFCNKHIDEVSKALREDSFKPIEHNLTIRNVKIPAGGDGGVDTDISVNGHNTTENYQVSVMYISIAQNISISFS